MAEGKASAPIVASGWAASRIERSRRRAASALRLSPEIGARRLHTILERLLEDVSFDGPDLAGRTVSIDAAAVRERVADLAQNDDLSRYVL